MAWAKYRYVEFDYEPDQAYPYECVAWRVVGGIHCGDRFTEEVADILIEAMRADGIEVVVNTPEKST